MSAVNHSLPSTRLSDIIGIQTTIFRFTAQAVCLDSDAELKSHITKLVDAIAAKNGKKRLDFSMDDLYGLATSIYKVGKATQIASIRLGDAFSVLDRAQSLGNRADAAAYIYRIAKVATDRDFFPLASKFIVSITASRMKRSCITYAAGILAAELYKNKSEEKSINDWTPLTNMDVPEELFDPIFCHLSREHFADLCALLKIGADINSTDEELKKIVINEFSYYTKDFFTHIYHKMSKEQSQYRKVLDSVCADLNIPTTSLQSVMEIEQQIVALVLRETIDKLDLVEKNELMARLQSIRGADLDLSQIAAGGSLAALIIGNFSGAGSYIAAASVLGTLTSGLGISTAFGAFSTMSSAMAVALGPIGISAAGAAFIATMSKSSPRKAIPAIIYIATIRAKLNTEFNPTPSKFRKYQYVLAVSIAIVLLVSGFLTGRLI